MALVIWLIVIGIFVAWFAISCAIGLLIGQLFAKTRENQE